VLQYRAPYIFDADYYIMSYSSLLHRSAAAGLYSFRVSFSAIDFRITSVGQQRSAVHFSLTSSGHIKTYTAHDCHGKGSSHIRLRRWRVRTRFLRRKHLTQLWYTPFSYNNNNNNNNNSLMFRLDYIGTTPWMTNARTADVYLFIFLTLHDDFMKIHHHRWTAENTSGRRKALRKLSFPNFNFNCKS